MPAALLDTDMLMEFLKRRNPQVGVHAAAYLAQHGGFTFSAVTRFEVLRGLKEKGAARQVARFGQFLRSLDGPAGDGSGLRPSNRSLGSRPARRIRLRHRRDGGSPATRAN